MTEYRRPYGPDAQPEEAFKKELDILTFSGSPNEPALSERWRVLGQRNPGHITAMSSDVNSPTKSIEEIAEEYNK